MSTLLLLNNSRLVIPPPPPALSHPRFRTQHANLGHADSISEGTPAGDFTANLDQWLCAAFGGLVCGCSNEPISRTLATAQRAQTRAVCGLFPNALECGVHVLNNRMLSLSLLGAHPARWDNTKGGHGGVKDMSAEKCKSTSALSEHIP